MGSEQTPSIRELVDALEEKARRLCGNQKDLSAETASMRNELIQLSYLMDSAQWRYMNVCPYLNPVFRKADREKRHVRVAELSNALQSYDADLAEATSRSRPPGHASQCEGTDKARLQQRPLSDFREGHQTTTARGGDENYVESHVSEISGQAGEQDHRQKSGSKRGSRDPRFTTTSGLTLPSALAAKLRADKAAAVITYSSHHATRPGSSSDPMPKRSDNSTRYIREEQRGTNSSAEEVSDADHECDRDIDDGGSSSTEYDSEGWILPLRKEPPMPSRDQVKAARSHPNIRRVWGASNRWLNSKYRLEETHPCSACRNRKKGAFTCYRWHPHARRVACVRCYLTQQCCSFVSDATEQLARTAPRNMRPNNKNESTSTFDQGSKRRRSASLGLPRDNKRSRRALSVVPGSPAEFVTTAGGHNISQPKSTPSVAASLEKLKKQLADAKQEHKELNRYVLGAIKKQEEDCAAGLEQAWTQVNTVVGGTVQLGKLLQQQQQDLTNILKGLRSACGGLSTDCPKSRSLAMSPRPPNIGSRPDS